MEVCSSHPVGSGNRKGSLPHPSSSLPPFMWQLHHTALVWTLLSTKALYSVLICPSKIHSLGSSYAPDIVQSPGDGQQAATCDVALVTLKTSGLNNLAEKKRFQKDSCFFQTLRLLRTMDLKERGTSPGISCCEMEKVHSRGEFVSERDSQQVSQLVKTSYRARLKSKQRWARGGQDHTLAGTA